MALSVYAENLVQTLLLTTSVGVRPTAWYVGLHSGTAGTTGATNELSVTAGYARQPQTFNITGNIATGVVGLSFGPCVTTPWGTVTDFSLWDAPVGGNCLWVGTVGIPVAYTIADTAIIAAGALTFQIL